MRTLTPSIGFDLDDLAAAAADQPDPAPALHMNDLTYILNNPEWLPDGYLAERRGHNHWLVTTPEGASCPVTTDRTAHDYAGGAVEFFGPGSPAFPAFEGSGADTGDGSLPRSITDILRRQGTGRVAG